MLSRLYCFSCFFASLQKQTSTIFLHNASNKRLQKLLAAIEFEKILVRQQRLTRVMTANKTDEQLVEIAVKENPDAFGEIVKRWERKIFALCFGILRNDDQARDAAQETFIAAYKNLPNFRGEAKVSSWLHRIAVNQCLTKQRRTKLRGENSLDSAEFTEPENFFSGSSAPNSEYEKAEKLTLIRRAVDALPPDLKEVIVLKEFQEMTFQEISDKLNVPLSTIKSRVYTALKQLRLKLERAELEII